jgi:hypothetical protein
VKSLVLALTLVVLAPARARACASCACGDPTLTSLGTEKPARNRLRASLEARHRVDLIGVPGVDELRLAEQRLDGQLAWAPHERVFLMAALPVLRRDLTYDDGFHRQTWGVGDLELSAKLFLFQDRAFSPRHLVAVMAGAKLPTAPVDRRLNGQALPPELQAGTGSFDAMVGASYAHFAFPWSAYASAQLLLPGAGPEGTRADRSLRGTLAAQRHLGEILAVRLALDLRFDGRGVESGVADPNSGGLIAFAAPEVLVSPVTDLALSVWIKLSMLNRLDGRHEEPFVAGVSAAYDF